MLEALRGLWMGKCGRYGQEIIQVRFTTTAMTMETTVTTTSSSSAIAATAAPAAPPVIMEGLKIVSHAKVPANEWCFRVDVSGPLDTNQALTADPRPVYTVDRHKTRIPRVLLQEAQRFQSIYRGKGQINASRKVWAPQEVGVDVLVLRPEENDGKGGLWMVWPDEGRTSRHCVDLTRLMVKEGGEEEEQQEDEDEEEW